MKLIVSNPVAKPARYRRATVQFRLQVQDGDGWATLNILRDERTTARKAGAEIERQKREWKASGRFGDAGFRILIEVPDEWQPPLHLRPAFIPTVQALPLAA